MSRHRSVTSRRFVLRRLGVLVLAVAVVVGVGLLVADLVGTGATSGPGVAAGRPSRVSPPVSLTPTSSASPRSSSLQPSGRSSASSSAGATFPAGRARAAVTYASGHGMTSAVAVMDLASGRLTTAGDVDAPMLTASVVKTMIATRVLLQGQMYGRDEQLAYVMITESDNDAAYALYDQVGGDGLLPWIAAHYGIADLGEKPAHPGLWGSTRITARGMARFLTDVHADRAVWPWLSDAMAHHAATTNDGDFNGFGLAALPDAMVKNGWNTDDDPAHPGDCQIDSVGYVDGYAVVVLNRGSDQLYETPGEQVVTSEAKLLFP